MASATRVSLVKAARLHGAVAVANHACSSVRHWPPTRRHDALFRLPLWHGRSDIRTVAFWEWRTNGRAWVKRGGCTAGEDAKRAARLDLAFVNRGKGYWASRVGDRLYQIGHRNPAQICVTIRGNGPGASTPDRAGRVCGQAGAGSGNLGSGDRASLPGRSTRYRLVWLVCAHCNTRVAWLFYDERDIPVCVNAPHGRMELQR
jgi:hypothetical protein